MCDSESVTTGGSTQVRRHGPPHRDGRTGVLSLVVTAGQDQASRTQVSAWDEEAERRRNPLQPWMSGGMLQKNLRGCSVPRHKVRERVEGGDGD